MIPSQNKYKIFHHLFFHFSFIPKFHYSFLCAFGGNATLNQLFTALRGNRAKFDEKITDIEPEYGPFRVGDIPHSQASILKAKTILEYNPKFGIEEGLQLASKWYFDNLQSAN